MKAIDLDEKQCRIDVIDYLKCIFIILMVVFHLSYIGDKYPYAKQIVYTFHMPGFLIMSGYLANMKKDTTSFIKSLIWIFIPYAIMEAGYVYMSSVLPVREKVVSVTPLLLLDKIFIAPMGPYWYLHTLIICYLIYYITDKVCLRMTNISFIIIQGLLLWLLSNVGFVSMANAIYFISGVGIQRFKMNITSVFQPSVLAVVPLCILCCSPGNLNRYSLAGVIITYLSVSVLLVFYFHLPEKIKSMCHFIGKNTFLILLFSPIFTMLSKVLLPLLSFDPSGFIFACVATVFTICGCFLMAWVIDWAKLSLFLCGKQNLLVK